MKWLNFSLCTCPLVYGCPAGFQSSEVPGTGKSNLHHFDTIGTHSRTVTDQPALIPQISYFVIQSFFAP